MCLILFFVESEMTMGDGQRVTIFLGWTISDCETWDFDFDFLLKLEIIGNVSDNPEILDSR